MDFLLIGNVILNLQKLVKGWTFFWRKYYIREVSAKQTLSFVKIKRGFGYWSLMPSVDILSGTIIYTFSHSLYAYIFIDSVLNFIYLRIRQNVR